MTLCTSRQVPAVDVLDNDAHVLQKVSSKYNIRNLFLLPLEDLSRLGTELKEYDIIHMLQVLEHVQRYQVAPVVKTLFEHLKPGGRLIITVPNGGNPLGGLERYSDITHVSLYSDNSLRQLALQIGVPLGAITLQGFRIPGSGPLALTRRVLQTLLHLGLRACLLINGGVAMSILHPNITLILHREKSDNHIL